MSDLKNKSKRVKLIDDDSSKRKSSNPLRKTRKVKLSDDDNYYDYLTSDSNSSLKDTNKVELGDDDKSSSKKSNSRFKKLIIIIITLVLLIAISLVFLFNTNKTVEHQTIEKEEEIIEKEVVEEIKDDEKKELWKENKKINGDYIGQLVFESGLINEPVLRCDDNNEYFRTNWKDMSYDEEGSVFMDCRNTLNDQNIILYGHYVYPSYETGALGLEAATGLRKFTPLVQLTNESNYAKNKYVDLYLENVMVRYEIAVVYYCELDPEDNYVSPVSDMYYFYTEYDDAYFETYKNAVYNKAFYQTGVDITNEDNLLTLQTCVENREDRLEIVICKEISRIAY